MRPISTAALGVAAGISVIAALVGAGAAIGASRPSRPSHPRDLSGMGHASSLAGHRRPPARMGATRNRAAATPGATAAATPGATIQIGPITAHNGFEMYVTEQGCGSAAPAFQVAFLTGRAPDLLTHTYTGISASCTLQSSGGAAELRASLPGAVNIAADVVQSGSAVAHPGLPVGCGAPFGPELPATASGRVDVTIHPGVFGRLNASRASAEIFPAAPQQCPAVQPSRGRELTADIGPYILDAAAPAHGSPVLDIYDSFGDGSATGLSGTLQVQLGGSEAYALTNRSGSARIGSAAPLTSGSLGFSALPACPGATAVNGNLTGTLTIDDPLLGPLAIRGSAATLAFSGIGRAQAGGCNGPGSQPVEPELVSNCSVDDGSCSVANGTNTATLSDETDAGTQTVSSMEVDFGDGSAPVSLTLGGTLVHTYSQPGYYTATLTVTDAVGTISTATTTVVISP